MSQAKAKFSQGAAAAPFILALETATPVCGVALLQGAATVCFLSFVPPAGHSAHLMPAIDALVGLTKVPKTSWSALVISRGPGSFTGLRIGMSTAKALSLALDIPLYGVSTLEALASVLPARPGDLICPVLDARKGQVFTALYRVTAAGLETVSPPVAIPPASLPQIAPRKSLFTGDGFERYEESIRKAYRGPILIAPVHARAADAAAVGRLGLPRLLRREASELVTLVPEYVRASDAELSFQGPGGPCHRD